MSEQISQNKKVHFVDYAGWYQEEREELEPKIIDVIKRGELILRQEVRSFENNLAKYVGTKYAVGTSSGTDAIRLALIASGIKPGDEVITSTHTFAATVAAISQAGGVPVLADIKQEDYLIDVNSVKCLITDKTKFIIPVSLNGRVADMEELEILADEQGITIIEDSAQALGAYRNSRSSGSFGLAGCFSFFPAKTLGSLGDAGAVTTKSKSLYEKIRGRYYGLL